MIVFLVANDGSELKDNKWHTSRYRSLFCGGGINNGNMSRVQPADAGSMTLMERVL